MKESREKADRFSSNLRHDPAGTLWGGGDSETTGKAQHDACPAPSEIV